MSTNQIIDDLPREELPDVISSLPVESGLIPIGVDIKFDFATGDIPFGMDLRLTNGVDVVRQWVMAALITTRDSEDIYSPEFGSTIRPQQATGIDELSAPRVLPTLIHDALIVHDRIVSVSNFSVTPTTFDDEATIVAFDVTMDDGTIIPFPEVVVT